MNLRTAINACMFPVVYVGAVITSFSFGLEPLWNWMNDNSQGLQGDDLLLLATLTLTGFAVLIFAVSAIIATQTTKLVGKWYRA